MSELAAEPLASTLRAALDRVAMKKPVITTLAAGKPNRIVSVEPEGVRVETERSSAHGRPAQLVPAWMLNAAWDHLVTTGRLENRFALATDGLNIKRSSAVCALLAQLPGVSVASSRPIMLTYAPEGDQ